MRASGCRALVAVALFALGLAAPRAHAGTRTTVIVAIAEAPSGKLSDARLIGASGEVFAPAGADLRRWLRNHLGGVAAAVRFAGRHGRALYVAGQQSPLYRLDRGAWHVQPLPSRGPLCLATQSPVGAVVAGRQLFTLAGERWQPFGAVKGVTRAVWAAENTVYVAMARGGLRRGRRHGKTARWTPIYPPLARGDAVTALAGDSARRLFALSKNGVLLAVRGTAARRIWTPPGLRVEAVTNTAGDVTVTGRLADDTPVVATLRGNRLTKPERVSATRLREPLVAIAREASGRIVVVSRFGRVYVRDPSGSWQVGAVSAETPKSPHKPVPGAVPALTQ